MSTKTDDLGDAQRKQTSDPISAGARPGSATPGQTGGIFVPADGGSRGGGLAQDRPLRPAARSPKGADTTG
jgi:hypothetical protein